MAPTRELKDDSSLDSATKEVDNLKYDVDREIGSVEPVPHVDPFAAGDGDIEMRTLTWWQAGMIMIAETISLGILSLPSVLASLGFVPGIILIVGLGVLATYTGYVFGQFKMRYPQVHTMADAGGVLFGSIGREVFGAAQIIFLVFSMGSHILTFTIAMNAITSHAACTIVWGIIGLVVFWILTLPRTLAKVSWLSIASFISIISAVLITMIGVGVEKPDAHIQVTRTNGFSNAFLSVANIVFAYCGHAAFFSFISELKNPRDFPKALYLLQICDCTMYIVVAIVVYRYAGPDVASPALGATGPILRKVAYGIALPTIAIAGVIYGHVSAKYIYIRFAPNLVTKRGPLAYGIWALITLILWTVAFIIAESIPVFNDLLSLVSSIFASWFTYGISGMFWLKMNKGQYTKSVKNMLLTALNVTTIGIAIAVMGLGCYSSGKAINDGSKGHSWSCMDNST